MTGYGGHVLFLLVQSISPPLSTHSMNILNLIVCQTFLSLNLSRVKKNVIDVFMLSSCWGITWELLKEVILFMKSLWLTKCYGIMSSLWCLGACLIFFLVCRHHFLCKCGLIDYCLTLGEEKADNKCSAWKNQYSECSGKWWCFWRSETTGF
jgi:hypothetical protein